MAKDDLLFCSALELRERIRARQLSSAEITEAVIERIDQTQPTLNAFITVDRAGAMKAARAADEEVKRGEATGGLHGVPISIKDIINTAGLRSTAPTSRDR